MITNLTTGEIIAQQVVHCDTLWKRGWGLMFRRSRAVAGDRVFLFVEQRESVVQTTITMLFVFFPIAVVWLDGERRVVDKVLARPFRLQYAPQRAAQYYIEGKPSLLERVNTGDQLQFE